MTTKFVFEVCEDSIKERSFDLDFFKFYVMEQTKDAYKFVSRIYKKDEKTFIVEADCFEKLYHFWLYETIKNGIKSGSGYFWILVDID
jgi:hypothetical protein